MLKSCKACGNSKELDQFRSVLKPTGSVCFRTKCRDCEREQSLAYDRDHRDIRRSKAAERYAANPVEFRQKSKDWRASNPEKVKAANRAAYTKDPAAARKRSLDWSKSNPEKARKRAEKWKADNAGKHRAWSARWKSNNIAAANALSANRRAAKLVATPSWANRFFIAEAYHLAKVREAVCGGKWHVDHIVPLQSDLVCGLHCESNLQVIPGRSNSSKGNRYWPDMP